MISVRRTSPSRCTSATSAPPASATRCNARCGCSATASIIDNHIGDWGTQFGKLLLGWKQILDRPALERDAIAELERLYKIINAECDANPARLEEAKSELVKLQAGDAENIRHLEGNDPALANPVRHDLRAARREI